MASSIVFIKLPAIHLALLIAAQVCVASGPSPPPPPPPPPLLHAPIQGSMRTSGSREGAQAAGKDSNTTTAAALKVAGASLIVSVRLTDCDWPPGRSLERAAAIAAAAAAATSTATGPISNSSSSSSSSSSSILLQGTSPMARAQVLCVYDESARRRQYQHQGRGGGIRPADVPGTVTVAGVPLAHCALGAPLGLRYLLALRRGALPGAPLRLISSTPLVGDARSVSRQLDGAVAERFCLVDPKPRRSWRRDWRRRRRSRSLLQQQAEEGGGAGQQQQQQEEEVCGLSPDAGPCGGSLRRWFYDGPRSVCRRFAYSGCGGNANNFATAAACAAACPSE